MKIFRILYASVIIALCILSSNLMDAQCIVINEIMINGGTGCDGNCSPSTEEWTELYNTCDQPVDIGCFVLGDGDFTITIPAGTVLAGNDYYVIGSTNSNVPIDLDVAACGCTAGSSIGVFTNGNEQILLLDPTGVYVDAVYWGNGQFPASVSTIGNNTCSAISYTATAPDDNFELIPTTSASTFNGCVAARSCDGSSAWVIYCAPQITANASNGAPAIPDFAASQTALCPGDCIDFSDESSGDPNSWQWSFPGSNALASNDQNPANICYPDAGSFDVALSITNSCGSYSFTQPTYISVGQGTTPTIIANGPLSFCTGGSVTLSTSASGILQWFVDGGELLGETSAQLVVTEAGTYTLTSTSGGCIGTSNPTTVTISTSLQPQLLPLGSSQICDGQSATLFVGSGYSSYEWYLNGGIIQGAINDTYNAIIPGDYYVIVGNGTCTGSSNDLTVTVVPTPSGEITPQSETIFCEGLSVLLLAPAGAQNYLWYFNGIEIDMAINNSYQASNSGNYTVLMSNGSCSYTTQPINVQVIGEPDVSIFPDGVIDICEGENVTLQATSGLATYQWFKDGNPINGETSSSIVVSSPGFYSVEVNNGINCSSTSDVAEVQVNTLEIPVISSSAFVFDVCEGIPFSIIIPNAYSSYQWYLNASIIPGAQSDTYFPTISGTYYVSVTVGSSCVGQSLPVDVQILPSPNASINPPGPISTCSEEPIVLQAGGGGNYQWLMSGNPLVGETGATYLVDGAGAYSVAVSNAFGCVSVSPVVSVIQGVPAIVQISTPTQVPCQGDIITLSVPAGFSLYNWSTGGNNTSINVTTSGTYSILVQNAAGCFGTDDITIQFQVPPSADAGSTIAYSDCSIGVQLTATGTGTVLWSPANGLSNPTILNPIANPEVTTVYTLTTSNGTCTATDFITVYVDCSSIYIPNVFTPNKDGKNDYFEVIGTGIGRYKLQIYNRWGELLFETDDIHSMWDGNYQGSPVADGTYVWVVEAFAPGGKNLLNFDQSHGMLTLLR